ncbi:MAG: putative phage abortive infection protein [Proteobacteria bacterium]|nr:putative phage abortive infection protein [Pseudomonadota bacterium]MBU1418263.1 putative phage abortive infection protein [Pseudomonadota bacterium]MBU1453333.1 putative phage abortive infection protein [Pseudomonadota bacterium]
MSELRTILDEAEYGLRAGDIVKICKEKPSRKSILTVFSPFAMVVILFTFFLYYFSAFGEKDKLGDSFGTLNTLFSGLAFAGLIVTLFFQRKEIIQNKEELNLTRIEFKKQNNLIKDQNFEGTFFQLLRLHQEIVNSINLYNKKNSHETVGRDCFKPFYNRFVDEFKKTSGSVIREDLSNVGMSKEDANRSNDLKTIKTAYKDFHEINQAEVGHYFRNMYNILKFIHQSDVKSKTLYSNLLRAQLSAYELLLLFYNCLSDMGNEKFKPLLEEYALLKSVSRQLLIEPESHILFYDQSAFNKSVSKRLFSCG